MEVNLMMIDDEPIHHKQVERIIKALKIEARLCSFLDASEALAFILNTDEAENLPDLILLDLNMPRISGWGFLELFETIRPCLPKPIDIVILSSSVQIKDIERSSAYDCIKGLLMEPLTETVLMDILKSPFVSFNKFSKYLSAPAVMT